MCLILNVCLKSGGYSMKGKMCKTHIVNFPGESEFMAVNKFYKTGRKSTKTGQVLYYSECKRCMKRYRMLVEKRLSQDEMVRIKRDSRKTRRARVKKKLRKLLTLPGN